MTTEQKQGYDFAKGVTIYLVHCFLLGTLLIGALALVRNSGGWGLDDSDRDGWNRSGLTVYTDAKTGVQYLSDGHGGLTRRYSRCKTVNALRACLGISSPNVQSEPRHE